MLISHIYLLKAANEGTLERRRRAARKAFKEAINGKDGYRLWTLISPQRRWDSTSGKYSKEVTSVRLIIRVEQWGGGMRCEHTVSGWITPNGRGSWSSDPSGMTALHEELKVNAMGNPANANWNIKPDIEELRSYAQIVVDYLGGDCLTDLRLAALRGKGKAVIGT